jgi:Flp pilus assembly protein TadB
MKTAVLVGVLVGMLVVLMMAPAASRLRHPPRGARASDCRRHSRLRPPPTDYAALLDAIARQVRSGSSLANAAIDEIDPTSPLVDVVDQVAAGRSFADALAAIAPRQADLALTVQALSATAHLGGPIAATLDEGAAVLRERAAARAERRAHASQARLSARVLTVVPLAFAAWSALASQRTRDIYVTTVTGGVCAVCGLALNLVGWRWIKRIIGPT